MAEKIAVLMGERPKAEGRRAVRKDELEREVERIVETILRRKGIA